MDPEIQRELEEQFREMIAMLSQTNATMAGTVKAMSDATSSMTGVTASNKNATSAQNANSQAVANNTGGHHQMANAQQKAVRVQEEFSNSLEQAGKKVGAAIGGLAGSFGSLTKAMMDGKGGFSEYNSAVTQAGNAVSGLAKDGTVLGAVFGVAVKATVMLSTATLTLVDQIKDFRDGLAKTSGVTGLTATELSNLSKNAGFTGEKMAKLQSITSSISGNLLVLGNTAGQGAARFLEVADVGEKTRRQFSKLGISFTEITELQAKYIQQQANSGNASEMQAKSAAKVREESIKYALELNKLTTLTGKNAETLQADRDRVLLVREEQQAIRAENIKIARLEKSEDARDREEALRLKKEQDDRLRTVREYADVRGAEEAMQVSRVLRNKGFDSKTKNLAVLGLNINQSSEDAKLEGGGYTIANRIAGAIDKNLERMPGIVRDNMSLEANEMYFGSTEALLTANKMPGTIDYKDAVARAAALQKETLDIDGKKDPLADILAANQEAMINVGKALQTALTNQIPELTTAIKDLTEKIPGLIEEGADALEAVGGIPGLALITAGLGIAQTALTGYGLYKGSQFLRGAAGAAGAGAGASAAGAPTAAGKGAKILRAVKGAAIVTGITYGADAAFGALGMGKDLDSENIQKQDDKNWERASALEKTQSSLARGIEHIGRFFFLDNLANQGQADRVKSETEYLNKKYGPESATEEQAKDAVAVNQVRAQEQISSVQSKTFDVFAEQMAEHDRLQTSIIHSFAIATGAFATVVGVYAKSTGKLSKAIKALAMFSKHPLQKSSATSETLADLKDRELRDTRDRRLTEQEFYETLTGNITDSVTVFKAFNNKIIETTNTFRMLGIAMADLYYAATGKELAGAESSRTRAGGGGGGGDTTDKASKEDIDKATKFFEGKGWTKEQAAGIVGNLITESGLNPKISGDGGKAYGIAQWHPDRQLEFKKKYGKDIKDSTLEEQMDFVDWELRGGTEQKAGKSLMKAKTASDAARIVAHKYERPKLTDQGILPSEGERVANAEAIMSGTAGTVPGGATGAIAGDRAKREGKSELDIVDIGKKLEEMGLRVSEHPDFGKVTAGVHKGKGHREGRAIDVNFGKGMVEANDPVIGRKFDDIAAAARKQGYTVIWRDGGVHDNHMHIESPALKAAKGGFFNGPKSGYPVELHGGEMVAPLDMNSALAKLAKTPATQAEENESTASLASAKEVSSGVEKLAESNLDFMRLLSDKLDIMIDSMVDVSSNTKKLMKNSRV